MIKISGYLTCRNAAQMNYPFVESIKSLLDFCDEVIVADSSDGGDDTLNILKSLADKHSKLKVYHVNVPWDAPNHGVYDGQMKAMARSKCTGDYLWQSDLDEVVDAGSRKKIEDLLEKAGPTMEQVPILCLPVVEYWGPNGKSRIDVNPWKWRLSKNLPYITHGIPANLRKWENGLLYAKQGTDGCDYIHKTTGEVIPSANFMNAEIEQMRREAINNSEVAKKYSIWFSMVCEALPYVHHYSWYSISGKILKFKNFWNNSWLSLYNEKKPEGWNPFFANKSLKEVSEQEIIALGEKLEAETGGHIFHAPWNGTKINHFTFDKKHPTNMKNWCKKNK